MNTRTAQSVNDELGTFAILQEYGVKTDMATHHLQGSDCEKATIRRLVMSDTLLRTCLLGYNERIGSEKWQELCYE